MLEAAVLDALEQATGSRRLVTDPSRVGLVVGTSSGGIGAFCDVLRGNRSQADAARYASAAEYVARQLGVRGPVMAICTVCASGAQAIAEGASWVASGEVDFAIAAGFDPLEPFVGAGFDALAALAERPYPFRKDRSGLVLGEASAALVLSNGPASTTRGVVAGWGHASDAFHLTAPHPEGVGLALAIERAIDRSGVSSEAIRVINAHGTATPYNDRMESKALERVFGPRAGDRAVYTVKGTIGHTLGAAGALEAVVAFASMDRGLIPPTCTEGEPDPDCDLNVVTRPRAMGGAYTLSLSAGFGGVNCALLLGAGGTPETRS